MVLKLIKSDYDYTVLRINNINIDLKCSKVTSFCKAVTNINEMVSFLLIIISDQQLLAIIIILFNSSN